jgi:D-inositol-3-phosphate glycosyltransferase
MRIAMVSEHASPLADLGGADAGGQNVHVAALATAIARRGHDVTVYTRRDDPRLPDRVPFTADVTVEHLNAGPPGPIAKDDLVPYLPELAEALRRSLSTDVPAVLHAHYWMSGLVAAEVSEQTGVPLVQTFHALGVVKRRVQRGRDTSPPERVPVERELARSATRVIASCTDEARELVRMGAPRARIDIVPSGVDTELFTPFGPVAPRPRRPRLLAVSRLVPRKGIDDAIRALRWVPEAELLVAGGPPVAQLGADPEAGRLREIADQVGVRERVRLLGAVPHAELPALIRSADVALCLPAYEPFGLVPLETMACGVPVVGTAVGGLLDTVIDGVTGLLTPPGQPRAAAAAISRLLGDPALRRALGAAGIERVLGTYTWDRVAASIERSYLRAALGTAIAGRVSQETG